MMLAVFVAGLDVVVDTPGLAIQGADVRRSATIIAALTLVASLSASGREFSVNLRS
jgi:hypothetical protein